MDLKGEPHRSFLSLPFRLPNHSHSTLSLPEASNNSSLNCYWFQRTKLTGLGAMSSLRKMSSFYVKSVFLMKYSLDLFRLVRHRKSNTTTHSGRWKEPCQDSAGGLGASWLLLPSKDGPNQFRHDWALKGGRTLETSSNSCVSPHPWGQAHPPKTVLSSIWVWRWQLQGQVSLGSDQTHGQFSHCGLLSYLYLFFAHIQQKI